MFQRIHRQFGTAGLILSIVALVAALSGGAYAATAHSSKAKPLTKAQIVKLIKRYAKSGPTGPAGANGTNGAGGVPGLDGKSVTSTPIAAGGACGAGITGVKYTLDAVSVNICNGANGKSVTAADIDTGGDCGPQTGVAYTLDANTTNVCNGANGANGHDATVNYLFNTDTTDTDPTDPGSGELKLNNADPASATALRISYTDNDSHAIDATVKSWGESQSSNAGIVDGFLTVRKTADPGTFVTYSAKGLSDQTTYAKFTVAKVAGNGTFAANDPVSVSFDSVEGTLPKGGIETGTWVAGPFNAAAAGDLVPFAVSFNIPRPGGFGNDYFLEPAETQDLNGTKCIRTDQSTHPDQVLATGASLCLFALATQNWDLNHKTTGFSASTVNTDFFTAGFDKQYGEVLAGKAVAAGPSYAYGVWVLANN